ncbi:MAG: DNA polymerase III subunit beta [Herpetosiphonaceae bacterium]|nr:MAG: DNA polymerase III subunit beta [Herpetosiphonaceae bacterium]
MKLSCLQENLKRGLAAVSHAVASRSTLPVLSNILLSTDGGRLKLAATNLEIAITCMVGGKVDEEGAVTIPAKLLSDLVNNLPNDKITLQLDERTQAVTIICARTRATIKGIEADEFPSIPGAEGSFTPIASLAPDMLREVVGQVAFAAASDDSRPVLQGVLLRLRGDRATFTATDGFRLAVRTISLEAPVAEPQELIVPARALNELARIIADAEEPVQIGLTSNGGQLLFHTGPIDFVSRVIEGRFPDYERIIPTAHTTRTILSTSELTAAVKRAALFAAASGNVIKLTMEPGGDLRPGRLTLSANAAEVGENIEEVDALIEGEGGQLALNARYLQEALNSVGSDQLAIETQTPASPGVFKPVGAEGYIHLVMPMSVR